LKGTPWSDRGLYPLKAYEYRAISESGDPPAKRVRACGAKQSFAKCGKNSRGDISDSQLLAYGCLMGDKRGKVSELPPVVRPLDAKRKIVAITQLARNNVMQSPGAFQ
jgi:hypothetical protein